MFNQPSIPVAECSLITQFEWFGVTFVPCTTDLAPAAEHSLDEKFCEVGWEPK